jgi:hypothetical protein
MTEQFKIHDTLGYTFSIGNQGSKYVECKYCGNVFYTSYLPYHVITEKHINNYETNKVKVIRNNQHIAKYYPDYDCWDILAK